MNKMTEHEVIKSLAYGKSENEIIDAEDVTIEEVKEVKERCKEDIAARKEALGKGGFLE